MAWVPILFVALIAIPATLSVGDDGLGRGFRSFRDRMRGKSR